MSDTIHILTDDGEIVEVEREAGVQYRSIPMRHLPAAYQTDDAPMVFEALDRVCVKNDRLPTRDDARRQLRGAGIHPYPEVIENYVRERKMTEGDKKRHEKKVAEAVRKATNLDGRARKEVEGK